MGLLFGQDQDSIPRYGGKEKPVLLSSIVRSFGRKEAAVQDVEQGVLDLEKGSERIGTLDSSPIRSFGSLDPRPSYSVAG